MSNKTREREVTKVGQQPWIILWFIVLCWMVGSESYDVSLFTSLVASLAFTFFFGWTFALMITVGIMWIVEIILNVVIRIFPTPINTFLRLPKLKKRVDDHFEYEQGVWTYILTMIICMVFLR